MNYKTLTKEEVAEIWEQLEEFKTSPYLHQKISVLFGMNRDQVGFFHDVGTGKTIISLYLAIIKDYKRVLIVCPNSVKHNWMKEIKKHTTKTSIVLEGSTAIKLQQMKTDNWATITNYESLRWVYAGGSNTVDRKRLKEYSDYDLLIFDEIHKLKNWKAFQSEIALLLSRRIKNVIGLTGTPIGNHLLDLFNQMRVLDLGKTFGGAFWRYRREYFNEKVGWFCSDWTPKEGAEEEISQKLKERVIRYEKDECLDLPEKVYETRTIQMSTEQRRLITRLTNDLGLYLGGKTITVAGALAKAMKISQVTGGFFKDGDKEIFFDKNPKLDELVAIVEEVKGKVVIFHRFVAEGRKIYHALTKKGYEVAQLRGEIKDKKEQLLSFQEDPKVKAMVAHPQSGGIGIDLFQASVMIFYSNNYSYLDRHQCEGRIHRTGQEHTCLYIDLLGEESIDETVYYALMDKKGLSDRLLNRIKG